MHTASKTPSMLINADFGRRAVVHASRLEWKASPMAGVDRRMLDRLGNEVARATSIVRYAAGSKFSSHAHTGGEEFFVLDGVFQDEHGDYPAGSYVRNPPTSKHTPGSARGCVIFVKLWQFDLDDRQTVRINTNQIVPEISPVRAGVSTIALYSDHRENVRIEIWARDTTILFTDHEGLEIFVLAGEFTEAGETFEEDAWIRLPPGEPLSALAGRDGAQVWIKSGHLAEPPKAPFNAV